ncbi:MAG: Uma2 family endonuclease [Acidobacteriota bacterium]
MSSKVEATIENLYKVRDNGKAEIVNGELVYMSPTGFLPNYAAGEIFASLRDYARKTKRGYALTDNIGFIVNLPNRQSISPDASFYTGRPTGGKFPEGAPIFAVEVRSENDYGAKAEQQIIEKLADYFAAGTQVVWDVDVLRGELISVYRFDMPHQATVFRRGERANAEPALPGWTMAVDDLFL